MPKSLSNNIANDKKNNHKNDKWLNNYLEKRSFLLFNIDNILNNLNLRRESNKINTQDIFSLFEDEENDSLTKSKITWQKDYIKRSKLELLQIEKESLGVYMTGKPLEEFNQILTKCRLQSGLKEYLHLAVIEKVRKIMTKQQTMILALELSLVDRQIEGVIYSKNSLQYSPIIQEKGLFWIEGRIDDRKVIKKEAKPVVQNTSNETGIDEITADIDLNEQEYADKPKLIIQHISNFDLGFREFYKNVTKPKINIDQIAELNWMKIKTEPSSFTSIINDNKVATITLYKKYPEIAKKIKPYLSLQQTDQNQIYVEVWLEVEEGKLSKSKNNFWLNSNIYKEYFSKDS
jgi:DNA polymerase III alpha subunit